MEDQHNTTYTILVVDDSQFICIMYEKLLRKYGYNVSIAKNGKQAISIALQEIPDLVIMDIMMPRLDGLKTIKILKKMIRTREIPILVVTALGDKETVMNIAAYGINNYIHKPFKHKSLIDKINEILENSQKSTQYEKIGELVPSETTSDKNKLKLFQNITYIFNNLIQQIAHNDKKEMGKYLDGLLKDCEKSGITSFQNPLKQMLKELESDNWDKIILILEAFYVELLKIHFKPVQEAQTTSP